MHLAAVQIGTGIVLPAGYAHKRCLPDDVIKKLGQLAREAAKNQAARITAHGMKEHERAS
jgi:hypothetical protein